MKENKPEKKLEWIFFGIQQVLINPDKLSFNVYQHLQRFLHVHGIQLSFEEILASREDLILGHDDEAPFLTIARMYLSRTDYQAWHRQVHDFYRERMLNDLIIIPGVEDALRQLSVHYSLGLIADQPRDILVYLEKKRLLPLFRIHAISGIVKTSKPRKRMFEWAVNKAGSSFERCLMVGYRLNEDIIPARQLDMMTVQARWPITQKGYLPKAKKPVQYLKSMQRAEMWSLDSGLSSESPDEIVTSAEKLFRTIRNMDSGL